ncbi:DUF4056 domain-containing protein [Erwinia sp. HR93]|uniref:DUF4056 domain-containing protein n=1 Tax=Erwinia sp. HR93 TaxID=3094840 RepID=UPI002ADED746|nr:DUF4056 domain-containing protein [Erwinia sp. HR93]MEA1065125.1 DUF4056 domain-containing protein [Erwinia sp. HR93]
MIFSNTGRTLALALLIFPLSLQALTTEAALAAVPQLQATQAWPVTAPLSAPGGLRPCCAFGYNLKAKLGFIPVPLYRVNNVVDTESLGHHAYNDSLLGAARQIAGMSQEKNGILYTQRGGFIDIAHVRDTADMTFYLFSQLYPRLGKAFTLRLDDELAQRQIIFFPFAIPEDAAQAYTLAVWISAHIAFQVAAWHEIAQWYGFRSVPGFSEEISAFSPEDLYSNLLGARLSASLLLSGEGASKGEFNAALSKALPAALRQLGAQPARLTRFQFDMLDGVWWCSKRAVPDKFLVLYRNYFVGNSRLPTSVPGERSPPVLLSLPASVAGLDLDKAGELRLFPSRHMKALPPPAQFYHWADFPTLAAFAHKSDDFTLSMMSKAGKGCTEAK